MKIFKEKEQDKKSGIPYIPNSGVIIYPDTDSLENYKPKFLDYYFMNTLFKLVDYEDYRHFCRKMAENYINHNSTIISNLKNIGSEDIENIWDTVNRFLSLSKLGYSQIEINLSSKKITIYHHESPFVEYIYKISDLKVCEFLSVVYSQILSTIFETPVKVTETECKNEKQRDFCIFQTV